jgi:SAM-dependent MidA family methyltransferase
VTPTPLLEKIRALIEANGPLSVAEYMATCLGDPEHGYYTTRDPFGAGGDFVTAPEVSQMFGEIVGAWLIHTWRLAGAPSPVLLVELGPGRGTLMADVLRVATRAPDFHRAVSVHLMETSPPLRARQRDRLSERGFRVEWHAGFGEIPEGAALVVANEFFDALPLRQFVRSNGAWRERVVGLDANGALAFGIGAGRLDSGPEASEGSVLELRPAADALVAEIAARIVVSGGAALVIDYGHLGGFGDTLQAVRGHAFADPLASPGEADLTAHVDFAALARRARAEGAAAHGPMAQGAFLLALGLEERAARLGKAAGEAARASLQAAVDRLAGPAQMGALFKVMAVTRPGLIPPPFGV